MHSSAVLSLFTTLVLVGTVSAQAPTQGNSCTTPGGPPIEHLQALARQYHPEALTPDKSQAGVIVAFVLDSQCRVLHDTTGQRSSEGIDLVATLGSLFPGVQIEPFTAAGIAEASAAEGLPVDRPWIVWVVVKT